jgi:hypothetical protein
VEILARSGSRVSPVKRTKSELMQKHEKIRRIQEAVKSETLKEPFRGVDAPGY